MANAPRHTTLGVNDAGHTLVVHLTKLSPRRHGEAVRQVIMDPTEVWQLAIVRDGDSSLIGYPKKRKRPASDSAGALDLDDVYAIVESLLALADLLAGHGLDFDR